MLDLEPQIPYNIYRSIKNINSLCTNPFNPKTFHEKVEIWKEEYDKINNLRIALKLNASYSKLSNEVYKIGLGLTNLFSDIFIFDFVALKDQIYKELDINNREFSQNKGEILTTHIIDNASSEDKQEIEKIRKKYEDSEAGKAIRKAYQDSEAGKAQQKAYQDSEAGKAIRKAYQQSDVRKAQQKAYQDSEAGKAQKRAYYQKCKAIKQANIDQELQLSENESHDVFNTASIKQEIRTINNA